MRFNFFAFRFGLLDETLHHLGMLAWVDGQHADFEMRHCLFGYRFVLVLCVDVLEDLL